MLSRYPLLEQGVVVRDYIFFKTILLHSFPFPFYRTLIIQLIICYPSPLSELSKERTKNKKNVSQLLLILPFLKQCFLLVYIKTELEKRKKTKQQKQKQSCNIWKKFQVIFFLMHWLKLFLTINGVRTFYLMCLFFLKFYIWIGPWESWNPFKKFSEILWNGNSWKAKKLSCHFLFLVTRSRPDILVLLLSSVEYKCGCSTYLKRMSWLYVTQTVKGWWYIVRTTTTQGASHPILIGFLCT